MNFDKNTVIGLILLGLILFGFSMWQSTTMVEDDSSSATDTERVDSEAIDGEEGIDTENANADDLQNAEAQSSNSPSTSDRLNSFFMQADSLASDSTTVAGKSLLGEQAYLSVNTSKYKILISSKGASIKQFMLNEYESWAGYPAQLIWDEQGSLYHELTTHSSGKLDTRELDFKLSKTGNVEVADGEELVVTGVLQTSNGGALTVSYKFTGGEYDFDYTSTIDNMGDLITRNGYSLKWDEGIKYQEKNSVDESGEARAFYVVNGEETEIDADDDEPVTTKINGNVDYAAIKSKYFLFALNPTEFDGTVELNGNNKPVANDGMIEKYSVAFSQPYKKQSVSNTYNVYLGPIDFAVLEAYGYDEAVEFGWGFIGTIGRYLMMPLFNFIHTFVPNWGWTIIVFSILIKLLLYPLSIKQMQSTQKTKLLAPMMSDLNEKFKDDPQQRQKEMMKLYSEYGVNPAGGCVPMLLQMPIFFALWAVLRSNIAIRGADFLWIDDLANPEFILSWGFPILGISGLSGLALLTGASMFFMQKMTITDPRQKQMVYIMPVMFTFLFSGFPAGINLYYLVFNILSIGQQWYQNNHSKTKVTLEDLKNAPKKEGWLSKKMAQAQEMAEAQGRVPKGTYTGNKNGASRNGDPNNIKNRGNQRKKKKK
ncbi:MAG: membrane protein insertase YidC [Candidatus Kapaibacteriales bacterium]